MSVELEELIATGGGSINVITGPMFAGKSRALMEHLRRAGRAEIPCCLIRPQMDVRGEPAGVVLQTHAGEQLGLGKTLTFVQVARLEAALDQVPKNCKLVAVDEGQFFPDLLAGCAALARRGILVYVAALNGDYRQKPWAHVSELLANCELVEKLTAWCQKCKRRPAHFTKKLTPTAPGQAEEFDVSGDDKYAAVCRGCL